MKWFFGERCKDNSANVVAMWSWGEQVEHKSLVDGHTNLPGGPSVSASMGVELSPPYLNVIVFLFLSQHYY